MGFYFKKTLSPFAQFRCCYCRCCHSGVGVCFAYFVPLRFLWQFIQQVARAWNVFFFLLYSAHKDNIDILTLDGVLYKDLLHTCVHMWVCMYVYVYVSVYFHKECSYIPIVREGGGGRETLANWFDKISQLLPHPLFSLQNVSPLHLYVCVCEYVPFGIAKQVQSTTVKGHCFTHTHTYTQIQTQTQLM